MGRLRRDTSLIVTCLVTARGVPIRGSSPLSLTSGQCQGYRETSMAPFSINKWSPSRLTRTDDSCPWWHVTIDDIGQRIGPLFKRPGPARQIIDAINGQLTKHLNIRRSYAPSFWSPCARLYTGLTAHTVCIYINRLLGKPDYLQSESLPFPSISTGHIRVRRSQHTVQHRFHPTPLARPAGVGETLSRVGFPPMVTCIQSRRG